MLWGELHWTSLRFGGKKRSSLELTCSAKIRHWVTTRTTLEKLVWRRETRIFTPSAAAAVSWLMLPSCSPVPGAETTATLVRAMRPSQQMHRLQQTLWTTGAVSLLLAVVSAAFHRLQSRP